MAEPTVQDVLSKPDFDKLLPGVQFKVLAKVDPSLNSLSEEARPVILKRLKDKYGKRTKGGLEEKLPTEVPDPIRREAQFWDAATNRGIKTVGKVGEWLMSPANIPGTDQTPGPAAQAIHKAINDPEHLPEATTPAGKRGELFEQGMQWVAPLPGLGKGQPITTAGQRVASTMAHDAYQMGTRDLLSSGDPEQAAMSAATGAVVGGLFESLRNPLAQGLKTVSRRMYARVLQPGGGKVKGMARNVLLNKTERDIVGRGVIATSPEELENYAAAQTEHYMKVLDARYAQLGPSFKVKLQPIYDSIFQKLGEKGIFKEDGTVKNREFLNVALQKLDELTEKLGPELGTASPAKLREFRQSLEESLYRMDANGVRVVRTIDPQKPGDEYTDAMAHSIRTLLNEDPTIGAVNKEYHFWETAREVMKARNIKETGMLSAAQRHAYTAGRSLAMGAIGEEMGRNKYGKTGAVAGIAAGLAMSAAMESTAFKTLGAVVLDQFAEMLATPGMQSRAAGYLARQVAKNLTNPAEQAEMERLGKGAIDEYRAQQAAEKAAADADQAAADAEKARAKKEVADRKAAKEKEAQDKRDAKAKKDAEEAVAKGQTATQQKAFKAVESENKDKNIKLKQGQSKILDDRLKKQADKLAKIAKDEADAKAGIVPQQSARKGKLGGPKTPAPIVAGGPQPNGADYRNYAQFEKDLAEWKRLNPITPKNPSTGAAPGGAAPQPPEPKPSQPAAGGTILETPETQKPDVTETQTPNRAADDAGTQAGGGTLSERAYAGQKTSPHEYGEETDVLISGEENTPIPAVYRIRDLSELKGSHNHETFQPNPGYPLKNERDYSKPTAAQRLIHQSEEGNFNSRYHITDNPDALNGPPVTREDGVILGGSGRKIQLDRIHGRESGQAKAAYRKRLQEQAAHYGVKDIAKAMEGKQNPVLVREVSDKSLRELPDESAWAIRKTNVPGTAALSASERAMADAGQMTPELTEHFGRLLEAFGPDATVNEVLSSQQGPEAINKLIREGFFSENERTAVMDEKTGAPTKYAKQRISNAMLGKFFSTPGQIDNVTPALRNKLERIAAPVLQTTRDPAWDLMPRIKEAIEYREYMNTKGFTRLSQVFENPPLLGGQLPDYTEKTVQMDRVLSRLTPTELANGVRAYAARFAEYEHSLVPSLFEVTRPAEELTPETAFAESFGEPPPGSSLPGPSTPLP